MVDAAPAPVPSPVPVAVAVASPPSHPVAVPSPLPGRATPLSLDLRPVHTLVSRFDVLDEAAKLGRNEVLAGRILKVTEELGESAQAYIGLTGRNPRKGVSHTEADLAAELCDVILSAMVALAAVDGSWPSMMGAHFASVAARTLRVTEASDIPHGADGTTASPDPAP